MRLKFRDGLTVDETFRLDELIEEGRVGLEPVYDKRGRLIYVNVAKRPRPTLEQLRVAEKRLLGT